MNVLDRVLSGAEDRLNRARRRSPGFDHFARALGRYTDVLGGRLAAAIAYYGFFAVFALGLVAYAIFGAVLRQSPVVSEAVADFLALNLPVLMPEQIRQGSGRVGVIGLVLLVITGIAWVEAIRSSQRLINDLDQQPGSVVIRQLVDLAVLIGVFFLLGLSVGAVDALSSLLAWIFGERSLISSVSSWILAVVINMVLATLLLVAVPRLRMTPRRLATPVVLVAIGITLLNTVGRYYVVRMERNPAYAVVAGAVGLLIYLYLFNQLLLFGTAIAATSRHGRTIDLTTGRDAPDQSGGGRDAGGGGRGGTGRPPESDTGGPVSAV